MARFRYLFVAAAFVVAGGVGYLRARGEASDVLVGVMLTVVVALILLSRWKK